METIEIDLLWVKLSALKWGSTGLPLEKNVAASLFYSSFLFPFKKTKFCIQLHVPKKMETNIVIFTFFPMACLAYNGKGHFSRCWPWMQCLYIICSSFYFFIKKKNWENNTSFKIRTKKIPKKQNPNHMG